jgi:hypothetical protein
MIPVVCRVKHDPENGKWGDCVRACVATVMELDAEKVPHFFEDGCDAITGNDRMRNWLAGYRLAPFWAHYDGSLSRDELLETVGENSPGVPMILYGSTGEGDHVVVCQDGKIFHNPAWYGGSLIGPASHGHWTILVIART